MLLPLDLIKRYVSHDFEPARLADLLNNRVSEVEYLHAAQDPAAFADARIARIDAISPVGDEHVRLQLSPPGEEAFEITVGAGHGLAVDMRVGCMRSGSQLPGGGEVAQREVAGTTSGGMLLSEADLGIGTDRSKVLTFPTDLPESMSLYDALGLEDLVLEFDLEPHRPDLFSVMGFAREIAAQAGTEAKAPEAADSSSWPTLDGEALSIDIEDLALTRRYIGVKISGLQNGPSPLWMQNALRKLGIRPLNRIVDVTNFVLAELGQPLHAFDAQCLKSNRIGVRGARAGEKVTTLDGTEREVPEGTLLITDGDEPTAIAGIMGGHDSEVSENTTEIVLESATFDMFSVRRSSRLLSLRSEASLRFEKGLLMPSALRGAERAVHLYQTLCGPDVKVEGWVDARGDMDATAEVRVDPARVSARMGVEVDAATIRARLEPLGLGVSDAGDKLSVAVPDFRPDLKIPEDIEEEIARVGGYENIPMTVPVMATTPPKWSDYYRWGPVVRGRLSAAGLSEVYLMAWLGEEEIARYDLPAERLLKLKNTLSSQYSHFRTTSLPQVARAVHGNLKDYDEVALYELGKIYFARQEGESGESPVGEARRLCGAATALPTQQGDDAAYWRVRAVVQDLLTHLRVDEAEVVWGDTIVELPWHLNPAHYHPRRWVALRAGEQWLGLCGELHPEIAEAEGIQTRLGVFELDLDALLARATSGVQFTPPARFPSVTLHANLTAPERLFVGDAMAVIESSAERLLHDVEVINVYQGDNVEEGHKQVTLGFSFNAGDRSLRQEEAVEALERIASLIGDKLSGAKLEVPK